MRLPDTVISDNLSELEDQNPDLALELSRLPEIRWFKTGVICRALENLQTIYRYSPRNFDLAFSLMNAEGLSGARAYCTPLQALFWLIQDGKLGAAGKVLGLDIGAGEGAAGAPSPCLLSSPGGVPADRESPYRLERVLESAWNGEARSSFTDRIPAILARITGEEAAEEYAVLAGRRGELQIQGYIMEDFMTRPEIFDDRHHKIIGDALAQSRWKLFSAVADRLNSPDLISYYINRYFFFRKTPSSGVYFTFWDGKAQCTDAAYFTQFMLERAGYTTFIRSVKWDKDPWDGLHTGAGIILKNGDYLLVSNYTGINTVSGPYSELDALDEKISCGRKIIHRQWGAYFPPRYF